ncbi:hypothetical protein F5I97DRAFT_1903823 [Phlebopus sp. FC_14]|nr:hypothetical protein F5I97DRAFT_1903823 [Phlebopus sp. FC_14]
MPNALTRTAGFTLGPVVLETLVKHYFDRIKKEGTQDGKTITQLRQDELLYDEAFNIVKRFLEVATHHSVEEVQAFSNNRTPSPPWVHVVRLIVPISCCDEAASLVIRALGGEEHADRLVGGTKWWQVRGLSGIDAEWITARKDWQEAKKRRKEYERKKTGLNTSPPTVNSSEGLPETSGAYDEDMDQLRCILYAHGGGYYFGSIDQERYSIQRHARKINGRVFAINYRLAPQYPFPCALQDLVAAYLYLIRPPPEASHQPVKPAHIVVAGDSAGGGLTLALLQVLRDTGQPLPAGGVLISPWCDLTHSFPSVHTNTATDVLPLYGLSLQKPSVLWPPPSDEMTQKIHIGLRRRIRQMVHINEKGGRDCETSSQADSIQGSTISSKPSLDDSARKASGMPVDIGATTSLPSVDKKEDQTIHLVARSGELLTIEQQIHLYTQNSLLAHPLVSPVMSYLGGLPPLLFIASDKEVLRDEIIYCAHKAADPSRFPLKDGARALYPPLVGIEQRHSSTPVHLQVYDDTAHVVPVLFAFTTPGKFCYRAIATFTKHVTGMLNPQQISSTSTLFSTPSRQMVSSPVNEEVNEEPIQNLLKPRLPRAFSSSDLVSRVRDHLKSSNSASGTTDPNLSNSSNLRPSSSRPLFSFRAKVAQASFPIPSISGMPEGTASNDTEDVGGPRIRRLSISMSPEHGARFAGEASVYCNDDGLPSWSTGMIRERISTRGVVKPLEPTDELDAFRVPPEIIGVLSEKAVRRYLEGKSTFEKKYAKDIQAIEKHRNRNIDLAKKDIRKNLEELKASKARGGNRETKPVDYSLEQTTGSWSWAWVLDGNEKPPPSSIVSRRDTDEARRLARIADQAVLQEGTHISANSLWAVIVNFLTVSPEHHQPVSDSEAVESNAKRPPVKKSRSFFASLRARGRPSPTGSAAGG